MGKKLKKEKKKKREKDKIYGEGGVEKKEREIVGNRKMGLKEVDVNWSIGEGLNREKERISSILKDC